MNNDGKNSHRDYWKANKALIRSLLIIWTIASLGMSILFVIPLNALKIGNLLFGFWMAQ